MFSPASENDLPELRALIRDGAACGSFDSALAADCPESRLFFENLRGVVSNGVWRRPTQGGGQIAIPAQVLIYRPSLTIASRGFVALRGIGKLGYELWLTALDPECRGLGIGHRMLAEFLETPLGHQTIIAQCDKAAKGSNACASILQAEGFKVARVGHYSMWLVSPLFSSEMIEWIQRLPFSSC